MMSLRLETKFSSQATKSKGQTATLEALATREKGLGSVATRRRFPTGRHVSQFQSVDLSAHSKSSMVARPTYQKLSSPAQNSINERN
jgi:hypothetical protein